MHDNNIIFGLKEKITKLILLFEKQKDINSEILNENKELKRELSLTKNKLEELEKNNKDLMIAKALNDDVVEDDEAKKKINKLVREIDKCIALLNK